MRETLIQYPCEPAVIYSLFICDNRRNSLIRAYSSAIACPLASSRAICMSESNRWFGNSAMQSFFLNNTLPVWACSGAMWANSNNLQLLSFSQSEIGTR